jgi:3-isopropylmalate dehydrogenase
MHPARARRHIAVLPCDGAGKEVVPEAIKVLHAAGADYEFQEYDVNADQFLRTGEPIPQATWKELEKADAVLFGAVGDPRINDAAYLAGVLLRLRFELDLYVNLRPAKLYDDRLSPLRREDRRKIDLLIVRENTEGLYVGMGGRFKKGTDEEVAIQEDLNTHLGVTRIIEYAFGVATRDVVMVDKSNAMTYAGALWQERWKAVAARHREVKTRHLYVDAAAMQLVRDPTQFEVIVTSNLFGDILSDLTAELIGGMGIAPSGNINPETKRGLFEPVHGTAPDIAGKGVVNPIGAILSASMMVRHLGQTEMANAIEGAVQTAIRAGECTRDLGGNLTTAEVGTAVAAKLGAIRARMRD